MTKQKTKKRMYLHGECVIAEITELPLNVHRRWGKDSIMIIAKAETLGYEYRIKIKDGVEVFKDDHEMLEPDHHGILYMRNIVPTEISCLHAESHDAITLPEGLWQIYKVKEYDYISDKVQIVDMRKINLEVAIGLLFNDCKDENHSKFKHWVTSNINNIYQFYYQKYGSINRFKSKYGHYL